MTTKLDDVKLIELHVAAEKIPELFHKLIN